MQGKFIWGLGRGIYAMFGQNLFTKVCDEKYIINKIKCIFEEVFIFNLYVCRPKECGIQQETVGLEETG
jgi:hypothetical protein